MIYNKTNIIEKSILHNISEEQKYIVKQLLTNNVAVDSVAGSGKTTTSLHIAENFKNNKILLLTYNAKLKVETREKASKLGINNIEVHSFHSFCVKYYNYRCFTDSGILDILKKKSKKFKEFKFDLIILDECQDVSSLYYELICKIYKDNQDYDAKICMLGDKDQSIYTFNNADQRYIEYASELFNFNTFGWIKCKLSESFRITNEMALFINKCLLKKERIFSKKISGNKPRYIICDTFGDKLGISSRPFEEIKYYLKLGYKPSDIFILAPSIKSLKTPIRQLENKIKTEMKDVMIYVPTSDDEKLDSDLLEGKLTFSTFHQSKGLERKVVIIFNFDDSYFKFYKSEANPSICPNELYVAPTRGSERLSLFHHYTNKYLQFIDIDNIKLYCDFEKMDIQESSWCSYKNLDTSITNITKFLPQNIIDECYDKLEIIKHTENKFNKINIPLRTSKSKNETIENISDLNGIAIPSMFELTLKGKIDILDKMKYNNDECFSDIQNINIKNLTPEKLLYLSNCWNSYKTGFRFKICQITDYTWLEKNKLDECVNRLKSLNISKTSSFEYRIEKENEKELLNRKCIGYIDCIDKENNILYEFKCVQNLSKEHYLQLAFYMYMYELEKQKEIKDLEKNTQEINNDCVKKFNEIFYSNDANLYREGDKIKYKLFKEETGEIVKLYKTTNKIKVKNSLNKCIYIAKTQIISVEKKIDNTYKNKLEKFKEQAQTRLTSELNNKIKENNNKTKYILFNVLTNEYISISCEFEKLREMIGFLIYSKYVNSKSITTNEFMDKNKRIFLQYFEE